MFGPVVLCYLRLLRSLLTRAGVTLMGMVVLSSFGVKTDWNIWLSMLALVLLSDLIIPSDPFRHVIPVLSLLLLLMQLYSLLGFPFSFSGDIKFVIYSL